MYRVQRIWVLAVLLNLVACGETRTAPAPNAGDPTQAASPPAIEAVPEARTTAGPVRGSTGSGVFEFKGIRYGGDAATFRFAPPAPPEPWPDVASATEFGASCMQTPYPPGTAGGLFNSWIPDPAPPTSEDCLFLNVWTPGVADGGRRPVMVWLHGGGLTRGSGSSNAYNGVRLARRGDVVVVTVNHRLNVFGYTYLGALSPEFTDSGNVGLLDLVLALGWVRDNAESFGGEPDNVTIFGESGGGWKVASLMNMPAAEGLFHKAVIQSGPILEFMSRDDAARSAETLVRSLGVTPERIDRLRTMPADVLLNAYESQAAMGNRVGQRPVLDGRTLTHQPFEPGHAVWSTDVPLLIGTTRTETSLFIGAANPFVFDLTWKQLPSALSRALNRSDVDVNAAIETYRRLFPDYSPADVLFTATTDAGFLNDSHTLAERKVALGGAPVYFYRLDWNTPVDGGKWRAPHALDIGMVFDNVARSESMSGTSAAAQRIADLMSEAWLAFAKTGNPQHPGLPAWPAYDPGSRPVMLFDLQPRVASDPHGAGRVLFVRNR